MLFQQNLNTGCVQGLLLLSLQPPEWEPSPSPRSWIRREWKNPSSQASSYLLRQRKRAAESVHLTWGAWTIIFMLMCKVFQDWEPPHALSADTHQGDRRGCSFSPEISQGFKWQGIVTEVIKDCKYFYQDRPEKEEVFPHYLAKVLLQLQIKAALSRCLRAHRDLHRGGAFTILSVVPSTDNL